MCLTRHALCLVSPSPVMPDCRRVGESRVYSKRAKKKSLGGICPSIWHHSPSLQGRVPILATRSASSCEYREYRHRQIYYCVARFVIQLR